MYLGKLLCQIAGRDDWFCVISLHIVVMQIQENLVLNMTINTYRGF